jgi:hypothetical protein
MKQDHTEESILHTSGEQNTGNHKKPGMPDAEGADRHGGTRAGASTLEHGGKTSTQSGPDIERLQPLDEGQSPDLTGDEHAERAPERDERGRL